MKAKTIAILFCITVLALGIAIVPARSTHAAPNYAPTNPGTTNLVSWWALDESSGSRADSRGSNTLSDNNTVGSTTGKISQAANFVASNNEYLSRLSNSSLQSGDIDFVFGGWFYLNEINLNQNIITKSDTGEIEYIIYVTDQNNLRLLTSNNGTGVEFVTHGTSLSVSTWYFFLAWHDSVNNTLNVSLNNGTPASTNVYSGVRAGAALFALGDTSQFPSMRMDEIFYYKQALSSDERAWLYNSGSGRAYCEVAENCPTAQNMRACRKWSLI